jgi:hypothetical protein
MNVLVEAKIRPKTPIFTNGTITSPKTPTYSSMKGSIENLTKWKRKFLNLVV